MYARGASLNDLSGAVVHVNTYLLKLFVVP